MSTVLPPNLNVTESALRYMRKVHGVLRGDGCYRLPVYVACSILALVTNYFLGKEMASDMLNYHVYAGFSALNDRFNQDYFAAGPQSYFNPYAYVPFYSLLRTGLSALAISSLLTMAHSVILWLTFELAISVCPSNNSSTRVTVGVCSIALAFVNPILMQQLGSSFADITTAELVLAGWLLLVATVRAPQTAIVICAGLLLGAVTALKLTNAVHAIAGVALLFWIPASWRGRISYGLGYVVCLAIGFAIVAAPWSYHLQHMFGNPFFPLLNNVFHSPEFTTEPLRQFRFIPATLVEALWRPFAMLAPDRMVHEELSAPDPRYAVLIVLVGAMFIRWLWWRRTKTAKPPATANSVVTSRILGGLSIGLAADWVLWLSESGNSRYFLPMACVAAVIIVALLFRLFATRPKVRNYVLIVIFATQAIQLAMGAEYRWTGVAWDHRWFDIVMPEKLKTESNLYLTMGMQSNSFIAPFLSPGSGLINFSGSYTPLGKKGANGARVEALMRLYAPHLRILLRGSKLHENQERGTPRRSQVDDALARFNLRVDPNDCATITVLGVPPELEVTFISSTQSKPVPSDTTSLLTCRVIPDNADHSAMIARQQAVDLVLDRLEDACPELLQPRRSGTEHDADNWRRLYSNTDLKASVNGDWVRIRDPLRAYALIYVGRATDWETAPPRLACGRRADGYYAKVLN